MRWRPYGPQSLKYLPSGPLRKEWADDPSLSQMLARPRWPVLRGCQLVWMASGEWTLVLGPAPDMEGWALHTQTSSCPAERMLPFHGPSLTRRLSPRFPASTRAC